MKFISSHNNSTTALIPADQADLYGKVKKSGGKPELVVKVFTFVPPHSSMLEFATGTTDDMNQLLKIGGHTVTAIGQVSDCDWDGNVPFSNGHEIAQTELGFKTTLSDVLEVFLANTHPAPNDETLRSQ